jgi:hypothetical protein
MGKKEQEILQGVHFLISYNFDYHQLSVSYGILLSNLNQTQARFWKRRATMWLGKSSCYRSESYLELCQSSVFIFHY